MTVRTDKDSCPRSHHELRGVGASHLFEKPGAVSESHIRHPVSGVQPSKGFTRGQGTRPVMEPELICRCSALERARAVDLLPQPHHPSSTRKPPSLVRAKLCLKTP